MLLLLLYSYLFPQYADGPQNLALTILLPAAVLIIMLASYFTLVGKWKAQREFENGRSYLPNEAKPAWWQNPSLQTAVGIAFIFLIAAPLFMRFYQPLKERVENLLNPPETPTLLERLDKVEEVLAREFLPFQQINVQPRVQAEGNTAVQVNPVDLSPSLRQESAIPYIPVENSIRSLAVLNNANRTFICDNLQIQAMINRLDTFRQPTEERVRRTLIENSIMHLRALQEADGVACRPEMLYIAALSIQDLQNEVVEQCRTTGEYSCQPVVDGCGVVTNYTLITPTAVERDLDCDIGFLTASSQTLNALARPLDPNAPLTTQGVRATLLQTRLLAENSPAQNITDRIDTQVTMLEDHMDDSQAEPPFFTRAFIRTWLLFVGVSYLIGAGLGFGSLNRFVSFVRRQVPRPFYYSVAKMCRIVAWEAKIALEIDDASFDHIEWRAVGRTTDGGIHLRGALRDELSLPDVRGLLRATIYDVETDRWGKIIWAEARSGRLPPKPRTLNTLGDSLVILPPDSDPFGRIRVRVNAPDHVLLN